VEKKSPHYSLVKIQAIVAACGAKAFTKSALDGGRAMDLTVADMVAAIASLGRGDFHKSMTTYADHTVWQDVYHASTDSGPAYVKFTLRQDRVVISFKGL
jgi:motility quorum-sensing regulator / GCU-specific mRNA interferase toxin